MATPAGRSDDRAMIRIDAIQADSGRWRWVLMQDSECLATSTKPFLTELDCLLEIEKIRSSIGAPPVSIADPRRTFGDGSVKVW
jgi:hypothetical protein